MNNHNADPNKKVLSHTQIRAMAEIDGWKWGEYRFDGKWIGRRVPCSPTELASKRVRLADMSLPVDTDEDGDYPDYNDYNLIMGVAKHWTRAGSQRLFEMSILQDGYGVTLTDAAVPRIEGSAGDFLPIAIASALMEITKE